MTSCFTRALVHCDNKPLQNWPVIVGAATASVRIQLWYLTPGLVVLALVDKDFSEWEREKLAAQLLEFPRPNLGMGYFQAVQSGSEGWFTSISFTMVEQYGIHPSTTACVQNAIGEWCDTVYSAGCSRESAHEPRPKRLGRCYTHCYRSLWLCGTTNMQYRLAIPWMSLLVCDKLPL